MTAYDYAAQRWVDGQAGARVMLEQLRTEMEILDSGRALAFLRASGHACSVGEARARCCAQIARCEAELGRAA